MSICKTEWRQWPIAVADEHTHDEGGRIEQIPDLFPSVVYNVHHALILTFFLKSTYWDAYQVLWPRRLYAQGQLCLASLIVDIYSTPIYRNQQFISPSS